MAKVLHIFSYWDIEYGREGISNWVGLSKEIIKKRNISMETLVNAKHAEEVSWCRVSCSATLLLPKCCVQVVTFAKDCLLSHVKGLGDTVKMK
jgi:hypothetical protein